MARRGQRRVVSTMLFGNWRNKGTALLLALVIWGMTFGSGLTKKTLRVEVSIATSQQDQVVTDMFVLEESKGSAPKTRVPFDGKVKLTVSGQRHAIDALEGRYRGEFEPQPNGEVVLLDTKSYQLPTGIEVIDAEPYRVKVVVERFITEALPVSVIVQGESPEGLGYNATKVTTDPSTVNVRMPESYKGLVEVFTDPLDLSTRLNDNNFVELGLTNPVVKENSLNASLARFDGAWVSVKVYPNFEDARAERDFEIPVIWGIESGPTTTIAETTKTVKVKVKATPNRLDEMQERLEKGGCKLVIVTSTESGTHSVNLGGFGEQAFFKAGWPEEVQVVGWDPSLLSYEITTSAH